MFYMAVFLVSSAGLAAFVARSSEHLIERQVQDAVDLEAGGLSERYRAQGAAGLSALIAERLRQDVGRQSVYLLSGADGQRAAGNLYRWPVLPAESDGWARFDAERIGDMVTVPVVARVYSLPDGHDLLVGRVLTDAHALNAAITGVVGWGMGLTILLGVVGALILARHLVRRVDALGITADNIMQGHMASRMVLSGSGDEFDRLASSFNRMMDEIQHLVESIRLVSDNIAHDLRTPLNRLRSRMDVALLSPPAPGQYAALLEDCLRDADHLLATFNALLTISRAESGARLHQFAALDPAELVGDVVELYEPLAQEKNQSVTVNLTPGLRLQGDRHLLFQAVANLLDNAVKYTPPNGYIQASVQVISGQIEIAVSDSGPGIPADQYDRVQERFARLDETRTTPGNGLGLSLVRAVAGLHLAQLHLSGNDPGLRVSLLFSRSLF